MYGNLCLCILIAKCVQHMSFLCWLIDLVFFFIYFALSYCHCLLLHLTHLFKIKYSFDLFCNWKFSVRMQFPCSQRPKKSLVLPLWSFNHVSENISQYLDITCRNGHNCKDNKCAHETLLIKYQLQLIILFDSINYFVLACAMTSFTLKKVNE